MSKVTAKRLGDLINFKRGYDLPESQRHTGPYPVISSAGISGYHNAYKAEGESVITGRYGTLGEMHFIDGKYWPHNTSLYVTTFKGNNPKYIYYLLTCLGRIRTSDKSAVPGVNRNELHEMAVPAIEDKFQQQKVAAVLSALDAKIDCNNRINAELEAMAKTLYEYWFVQFDFPISKAQAQAMGNPDLEGKPYKSSGGKMEYNKVLKREIPEGWEVNIASKILSFNPSVSLKQESTAAYIDMDALPTHGYMTKRVQQKEFISGTKFTNGDVLFARITPCLENGKTGVVSLLDDKEIGFGSTEFIVIRGKKQTLTGYCAFLARSDYFRKFAITNMTGTSGRKRIEANVLETISLPIPPDSLLAQFEQICTPIFSQLTIKTKESQELAQLRDWLLPMLMNGQVTVA